MKAVYPSLSYTLFIVISIAAISILLVSLSDFSQNTQENYARSQLNYVADFLRNTVLDISNAGVEGVFNVQLPKTIVGRQYTIEFLQNQIIVSMDVGRERVNAQRTVVMNSELSQGKSYAPITIISEKEGNTITIGLV